MKQMALATVLLVLALPTFAQAPNANSGETKPGETLKRVPTIEELEARLANPPPPIVPIDPFDARTTAQSILDDADDEEIVWLYLALREAKSEYSTIKREMGKIKGQIRANRHRREESPR